MAPVGGAPPPGPAATAAAGRPAGRRPRRVRAAWRAGKGCPAGTGSPCGYCRRAGTRPARAGTACCQSTGGGKPVLEQALRAQHPLHRVRQRRLRARLAGRGAAAPARRRRTAATAGAARPAAAASGRRRRAREAGARDPWNGEGGDCTVTVGDCAGGAPPSAASCCPQPPQNRVPGSTEYPQDGHQPSIPTIMSLSGIPSRLACTGGRSPPERRDGEPLQGEARTRSEEIQSQPAAAGWPHWQNACGLRSDVQKETRCGSLVAASTAGAVVAGLIVAGGAAAPAARAAGGTRGTGRGRRAGRGAGAVGGAGERGDRRGPLVPVVGR